MASLQINGDKGKLIFMADKWIEGEFVLHIWHEDSENSATTQFWLFLSKHIPELKGASVHGFGSNKNLTLFTITHTFNTSDIYFIFLDLPRDNPKVVM